MGLDSYVAHVVSCLPADERRRMKRRIIRSLADQTRRMHSHRFVHHDYFWRNILVSGRDLDRFHLIDAHKGRCWRSEMSLAPRAIDLAALDAAAPWFLSRADRLRFLLRYRREATLSRATKCLARKILKLAMPMRQRQLRRVQNSPRPEQVPQVLHP
jgi:tRNA A-37 threonylcarbamoyl transferase component Bud32